MVAVHDLEAKLSPAPPRPRATNSKDRAKARR
jgi:hypothetical protein